MSPVQTGNDDVALFEQFMDGNDNAFVTLFERHNQRLYVYCLKIVSNSDLAHDLTQEMWERVIHLRRKPREVRNPVGLFLRIARNLCIDHLRARKHSASLSDLDDSAHPSHTMRERSEREELALRALDKLPYDYREVLVLNLYSGYRFDEIAEMLGKTPEAIWTRASRARSQLRSMIMAELGEADDEGNTTDTDENTTKSRRLER